MLKRLTIVLALLLLLTGDVASQNKSEVQAPKAPECPTLTWRQGHPLCDFAIYDGKEVKSIRFKGTDVVVLLDDSGDYLAFLVHITNNNEYRLMVNPASAFVKILQPKELLLLTIPADKVAKSMEKQGRWRSVLGTFLAGMATRTSTGTITDPSGNQSIVTLSEPDRAAQRNAAESSRERAVRNQTAASTIRDIGLRANTCIP